MITTLHVVEVRDRAYHVTALLLSITIFGKTATIMPFQHLLLLIDLQFIMVKVHMHKIQANDSGLVCILHVIPIP
jgi:hypothetical protein